MGHVSKDTARGASQQPCPQHVLLQRVPGDLSATAITQGHLLGTRKSEQTGLCSQSADGPSACADSERQNVESQYQGDYEASLNPWGDWKERERASRRTRLGLVDRVMYEFGQIVYGSLCAHS